MARPAQTPTAEGSALEPPLDRIAAGLESTAWAAELVDPEWRLRWCSTQLKAMLGESDDEALGVGSHLVAARYRPAWQRAAPPGVQTRWLEENVGFMLDDTPGGRETIAAMVPPEHAGLVRAATARGWPVWTSKIDSRASELELGHIRYFGARARTSAGRQVGTIYIYGSALPASLLAMVARGDPAMFQRMARLVEPGRREAALLFATEPLPDPCGSQPHVGVVGGQLDHGPLGLAQGPGPGGRSLRQGSAERSDHEGVGVGPQREAAGLAGPAHHPARRRGEGLQVLGLPACGAGLELGRQAGGQQQLEPEGELVGRRRRARVGVEQGKLVGQEVVDAGMGIPRLEQPIDRIAAPRRRVEGTRVLAQPGVAGERLGAGDRAQLRTALVEHDPQAEEGLQTPPEPRPRPAHALGDRAQASVARGVEVKHPVGLAVADGAQHDGLGPQRRRHRDRVKGVATVGVMASMIMYSTDPCPFCRNAKALLAARGIDYEEISLARDADGRAELAGRTGMMTFPQILVDGELVGGFRELLAADRSGALAELLAA